MIVYVKNQEYLDSDTLVFTLGFNWVEKELFLEVINHLKDCNAVFVGEEKRWVITEDDWYFFASSHSDWVCEQPPISDKKQKLLQHFQHKSNNNTDNLEL